MNSENRIFVPTTEWEKRLNQKGIVLWFTGLSGSGKTTIAHALQEKFFKNGYLCQVLDGDDLRKGINNNLSFSLEDREENVRRTAEVAKILADSGIITIVSLISPTEKVRNLARTIIGKKRFLEIYINTPLEICEQRDVKGLYKKARNGEIKNFTGIDSPFEESANAIATVYSQSMSIDDEIDSIFKEYFKFLNYAISG